MYGSEGWLAPLIARACIEVCPKNAGNFNVDNVRVVKIPGSGADASQLVRGVVVKREPEGTVRSAKKAKVAVFAQGIDSASTETKVCHVLLNGVACLTSMCGTVTGVPEGQEAFLKLSGRLPQLHANLM